LYSPLPNSSIEEREKFRHLKCVKTSFDKKQVLKIELKILQGVFFVFNVSFFNNLFFSVGLMHLLKSNFLPVMGMH